MVKQQLSDKQKRLDIDLWIIALTTLAIFIIYMIFSKPLMEFVKNTTVTGNAWGCVLAFMFIWNAL